MSLGRFRTDRAHEHRFIAVAALGLVGLSNASLWAAHKGGDPGGCRCLRRAGRAGEPPVQPDRTRRSKPSSRKGRHGLKATTDHRAACAAADSVIVAAPTDYDPEPDKFHTGKVETLVRQSWSKPAGAGRG